MEFSARLSSALLVAATLLALVLANSAAGPIYTAFLHRDIAGLSFELWVNDGLMAIFFLMIGLELKRELIAGELSTRDRALLPAIAAVGGMLAPALIHYAFNAGLPTARGFGIPMATDIAFTLGVLSLLRGRVPLALRAFVVAFAVIDDLGAIMVIALFYSEALALPYLAGAAALWLALMALNRVLKVRHLAPYLLAGALLWWLMLRSGVHATLAGVLLGFAIPFSRVAHESPASRLEHLLAMPVALLILPIFALANAGIVLAGVGLAAFTLPNTAGVLLGLFAGKPLGITLACLLATKLLGMRLPAGIALSHVLGAGMLGGIGFTMAIFIANLAFAGDYETINASKLAIFAASLLSGFMGWLWLRMTSRPAT